LTGSSHRYRNTVLHDREGNVVAPVIPNLGDANMPRGVDGHPDADAYRKALERAERELEKRGDARPEELLGLLQCREYLVEIDDAEIARLERYGH